MSWGAERRRILLHNTLVLSKPYYASQIYSSAATSTLPRLDAVHYQGLCLAMGALRSFPTECLYTESGVPFLAYAVHSFFEILH